MLSEKDLAFIQYWESVRSYENTFLRKITAGLPMAIIFCAPILLFVISVYLFLPEWFAKVSNANAGTYVVVLIALIIASLFIAYFRMHFRWEMNEQHYLELKAKQRKLNAASNS
jgi:uncharacterized membrane protein